MSKELLAELFDRKKIRILQALINSEGEEFYMREISRKARVPVATTHRIIELLEKLEIIQVRKVKKTKFYSLKESNNTKILSELLEEKRSAMNEFVQEASQIGGVQIIMLHGEAGKDKANIIMIGEGVDSEKVRRTVVKIKEEYGFSIIHLILSPQQFEQMSSMGLYPGKKVKLYEK